MSETKDVVLMINSALQYTDRRRAIRGSYLRYLNSEESPLSALEKERLSSSFLIQRVAYKFCVGEREGVNVEEEIEKFGDVIQVPVEESYDNFAQKILHFMKVRNSIIL